MQDVTCRPEPTVPATAPAAVAETHSAVVVFVGDRAYKLKKPVDLGFLDFSTRELRLAACEREVALNRRLAPDVYLGVADVHGPDGELADHLVVMRRLPDDRRLSSLLERGEPVDDHLRQVARQIASLHAAVATSVDDPAIGAVATTEAIAANWQDNVTVLRDLGTELVGEDEIGRAERLAVRYLAGRDRLFASRIADGQVRDGHGDLLAQDVFCMPDGPRILDCLEFSDRYRHGDVLLDVAFLAMDLERRGFPAHARRFLGWYVEFSGESHPPSLAHHYVAYRAHVRAKVACIRAAQGDADAAEEARQLHRLALAHLRRGRTVLALVGGLPGTGKSTLAVALADAEGWAVVRTDEVRRELRELPAEADARAPWGQGIYTADRRGSVYDEVLRRAETMLRMGVSVVLDGSWSSEGERHRAARLGQATSSDVVELRCSAPLAVARARVAARRPGADPSDATVEVLEAMAGTFDDWPSAATVATTGPVDDVLAVARGHVATALERAEGVLIGAGAPR